MVEGAWGAADVYGAVRSGSTSPPNDSRGFFHRKLIGLAKGVVKAAISASPVGRIALGVVGAVRGSSSKEGKQASSVAKFADEVVEPARSIAPRGECAPGQLRAFGVCIDPLFTGKPGFGITPVPKFAPTNQFAPTNGGTAIVPQNGTGQAVVGAFGLPAMVPEQVGSIQRRDGSVGPILRCGSRMVLGTDNLCYPKALLPRRSKFRKWRQPPRPTISAADTKAIRRAGRAKDRVLELAKSVGLHASKTKPKSASRPRAHQHLLAAPTLKVISEETN